jgi:hypothetical protein
LAFGKIKAIAKNMSSTPAQKERNRGVAALVTTSAVVASARSASATGRTRRSPSRVDEPAVRERPHHLREATGREGEGERLVRESKVSLDQLRGTGQIGLQHTITGAQDEREGDARFRCPEGACRTPEMIRILTSAATGWQRFRNAQEHPPEETHGEHRQEGEGSTPPPPQEQDAERRSEQWSRQEHHEGEGKNPRHRLSAKRIADHRGSRRAQPGRETSLDEAQNEQQAEGRCEQHCENGYPIATSSEEQGNTTPDLVTERAEEELTDCETEEVDVHDQLGARLVDPEGERDVAQSWEHDVDGEGAHRHEQTEHG